MPSDSWPPNTWLYGESVDEDALNTWLRDPLADIGGAWTAYTPTWSAATTSPTYGAGVVSGAYTQAGQLVMFRAKIAPNGTVTNFGTGVYRLSLPVAPAAHLWTFQAVLFDATVRSGLLAAEATGPSTTLNFYQSGTTQWTPTSPFTLASGDALYVSGTYEAA